jgi:tripartite-type tricarboxylate transporter receptor subunit TctC
MKLALTIAIAAGTLVGTASFNDAQAQEFPTKPVTIVVGVPPGGSADLLSRITAEGLAKYLGTHVIVENRPGANAAIATRQVARGPADGYTLFYNATNMASNLVGMKDPGYKWSDFEPLGGIAYAPFVMVVNTASSKAKTLKELVEFGKANPGKLTYASLGPGSGPGLVADRFKDLSGIGYREIPYKGGAQALGDVVGGTVDVYFTLANSAAPMIGRPNVAVLGVAGNKRSEQLPNVPTFAEQGYPDMKDLNLGGLWVAAGTPKPILEKLRNAVADTIKDPKTVEALKKAGQSPYEGDWRQFDKDMRALEVVAREDYKKFKIEPQ